MRGELWCVIAAVVLIISLILNQVAIALISLLFILTAGISRLWNRYCLSRVEYGRRLSCHQAFFGDEIVYEIEVANRKLLPLPWIRIEDAIPERVTLLKGEATSTSEERAILTNMFPVNLYHRVKRRFPIRCEQRGCFLFGPTRICSGDLFGLFNKELTIDKIDYLFVYPRLLPLDRLGIPSRQLFGDIRLKQHLFRDPVLTAGVRDYQPGDSLKRIHWKSTARLGKLQTRVYEPTTTVDISIFLDVRTVETPLWGSVVQLQELGVLAAAAIARHALGAGFRVGFHANQITRFSEGMVRVPHSRHPEQLSRILEALAQIHQTEATGIAGFIRQEERHIPWGSTLVVITAQPNEATVAALLDLKRIGRSVALIKIGSQDLKTGTGDLPVYQIGDDVAWDVLQEINMVNK